MNEEFALSLAASCWCQPTTSHLVMQPELAKAFADMLIERHGKMFDALVATRNLLPMLSCDNGVHSPSGQSEGDHWLALLKKQVESVLTHSKKG